GAETMTAEVDRRALLRAVPMGVAAIAGVSVATLLDPGAAHGVLKPAGTLSIPKLGLANKTIYRGTNNEMLAAGVGWGLWSAKLGSGGHGQLLAHPRTKPGQFRHLPLLR